MPKKKRFICFFLLAAIATIPSWAQVALNTGSIYGKVFDEEGNTLPGVSVTLQSEGMASKTVYSGESGAYRFTGLVPGTYALSFSLQGLTEVKQEEIKLSVGQTINLEIRLTTAIRESVEVSATPPLVDTKSTGTYTAFAKEYLQSIPLARDPWVILDQTPGVDVDQINVGGNVSGQQSNFVARGGVMDSNLWSYDGINITDPSAGGGTPTYYDFDSFEEIQITTAGADPSIQTGGVVINFITRRGGNSWAAQASGYFTNDSFQSNNVDSQLRAQHFLTANKVDQLYEYGGDLGGPLSRDRAWIWGAYRFQRISNITPGVEVHDFIPKLDGTIAGQAPDVTELKDVNLKLNLSYNRQNEGSFQYLHGQKDKPNRFDFPPNEQALDSTINQHSPTNMFKAEHSWFAGNSWFLNARFAYLNGSNHFDPVAGADAQPVLRLNKDLFFENGSILLDIRTQQTDLTVDSNYFLQNKLGGDHELKFGFAYKHASASTSFQYGGDIVLYDFFGSRGDQSLGAGLAKLRYAAVPKYNFDNLGLYAGDTWRLHRFTMNLGLRFDTQTTRNDPTSAPANSVAPDLLPALAFPGTDPGIRYKNLSPRLGATYDIRGNGKTIVRGNYARFYDNLGALPSNFINPLGANGTYTGLYVYYADLNGDGQITRSELLDHSYGIFGTFGGVVPGDARATVAGYPNRRFVDQNLKAPRTTEFLLGFERQLFADFSFSGTYIHRRYDRLQDTYIPGVTSESFTCNPITLTVNGETFTTSICDIPSPIDRFELLNVGGRSRTYDGLELVANKRMSNHWMLRVSGVIQNQEIHFADNSTLFGGSYQDPTNISFTNDTWWAPRYKVLLGSRWSVKVSAAYQLPRDFTVGAYWKIIDGNVSPATLRTSGPQNYSQHAISVLLEKFDAERLDKVKYMDLGFEKGIPLGNYGRLLVRVDIFNVFNLNTSLRVEREASSFQFREPQEIVNPRIFRFGLRYNF